MEISLPPSEFSIISLDLEIARDRGDGKWAKSMGDRFRNMAGRYPRKLELVSPATIRRERLISGVSTVFINRKTRRIA